MNYKGVIIEESLSDKSILDDLKIIDTKIEQVTTSHQTPYLKQWTLDTVEISEEKAQEVAERLSNSFDQKHNDWFADFKNQKLHYIIFPGKIFKVDLQNPALYSEAKKYGISIGIPEYQLGFNPQR